MIFPLGLTRVSGRLFGCAKLFFSGTDALDLSFLDQPSRPVSRQSLRWLGPVVHHGSPGNIGPPLAGCLRYCVTASVEKCGDLEIIIVIFEAILFALESGRLAAFRPNRKSSCRRMNTQSPSRRARARLSPGAAAAPALRDHTRSADLIPKASQRETSVGAAMAGGVSPQDSFY